MRKVKVQRMPTKERELLFMYLSKQVTESLNIQKGDVLYYDVDLSSYSVTFTKEH